MHARSPRRSPVIDRSGAIKSGRLGADGGGSNDEGQIAICQEVITNGYLNRRRIAVMTGDGFTRPRR